MKKNSKVIIGLVIVVILVVGGYAIFHKSPKPAAGSSGSQSSAVIVTKSNSSLGSYLAEPKGQALYTYSGDSSGVSNVHGALLASWPAYQDTGATTGLPVGVGTIKRSDNGETQYSYNGMPLYTFVSDSGGQVTGNGVSGFNVAKPSASTSSQSTSTTPSSTSAQSSNSTTANPY